MGSIYNSKFRSGHYISISNRLPKFGYKNDYPGPGHYLRFSEFGILVPKDYKQRGCGSYNTLSTKSNKQTNFETVKTEGNKTSNKRAKTLEK